MRRAGKFLKHQDLGFVLGFFFRMFLIYSPRADKCHLHPGEGETEIWDKKAPV